MKRKKQKRQKKKLNNPITGHTHNFDNNEIAYTLNLVINPGSTLNPSGFFITYLHDIKDYPWIRDLDHLFRINKYRKRMRQTILQFSDNDIAELALTTGLQ